MDIAGSGLKLTHSEKQQESTVGLLPDAEGESRWDFSEQECGEPMS